jgi:sugar phosphate isomerase/epimerase
MPPQIAFSTLACPDWSWRQILTHGPEYGYDGVEVRMIERETNLLARPEFAADQLPLRRQELAAARFQVCGLASSVKFDMPDRAERERQVGIGAAYLDLANELGASFIRVFGDVLPPEGSADERDAAMAGIAAGLQQLGELAEKRHVDVLIETHGDFTDSRRLHRLLEQVTSPRVGVVWDTHHPWRFHGEPLVETFARLGRWIRHTHWKDSAIGPDSATGAAALQTAEQIAAEAQARQLMAGHRSADYVRFGEGEFPAAECCRILRAAGYRGWFSYEWEKAWHPELADPADALPPFPAALQTCWES